ncbi:hypothetical protein PFF91_06210 [Burkholderia cenocepacia]|uniref:hypothetical protein n=1 Tax=Burkholderia cenocepacia TaxID=95486 RepID=UPI001B9695DB|nr:hypothetical protein [Burkholderia cenocepacia]MBR8096733.1 hypothetical protein [Burkholderia cenocepacia]MDA3665604.1 hypothetical protein [Burkholderia cenocepacia]MDA3678030.1 hypothetical protein [Burkholderia cenocepacia]MDA3682664.1 hypothetical protein [Burkholderia cenocepacia]MDA3690579.1 hypothetical protein [Burkholderia cenocepacia]
MSAFQSKSQFISHMIFDAAVRKSVLREITKIDRTHPVSKAIQAFDSSKKDARANQEFRAVLNRHWSEDGRFIPLPSRGMDGVSARRVNVMDGLGMKPNTINAVATATAQASVRSPLTANKTWNPKIEKLAATQGAIDGLRSALDAAIKNAMDYRYGSRRVSDAMQAFMNENGAQLPGVDQIDPKTQQRIDEEVRKADLTSQVLQSVDGSHPDIRVLLEEAERIVAALKALTQGHEVDDDLSESHIASEQETPSTIETAEGMDAAQLPSMYDVERALSQLHSAKSKAERFVPHGASEDVFARSRGEDIQRHYSDAEGAKLNAILSEARDLLDTLGAYKSAGQIDREVLKRTRDVCAALSNFSSNMKGRADKKREADEERETQTQAYADFMNGRDMQPEPRESDADRIERTRQAYERMNSQAT